MARYPDRSDVPGAWRDFSSAAPRYPKPAFAAVRRKATGLGGYLTAHPPSRPGSGRDDYYLYDLAIDGEVVIPGSRTPEFDACRVLLARGLIGKLEIFDAVTRKLRLTVDIEAGAKLAVLENRNHGPRLTKWKPFEKAVRP